MFFSLKDFVRRPSKIRIDPNFAKSMPEHSFEMCVDAHYTTSYNSPHDPPFQSLEIVREVGKKRKKKSPWTGRIERANEGYREIEERERDILFLFLFPELCRFQASFSKRALKHGDR